jgi:hypothetical protein
MKASRNAAARSGGRPGGATNGSAMKNGSSANSSSASTFGSFVSPRPVGTSGSCGWRVVRPNWIKGRTDLLVHIADWFALMETSPITWPSTSFLRCASDSAAAPM